MIKKLIGAAAALVIAITSIGTMKATAKVIEPKLIKTEKWTASYFIDKDTDNLYPYLACEADIYNDGEIDLYVWNTHEWNGFSIIEHTITINELIPFSDSREEQQALEATRMMIDDDYWTVGSDIYNNNIYSESYKCFDRSDSQFSHGWGAYFTYNGALSKMDFSIDRPESKCIYYHFTPAVEPTGTYNFHLFGHDITITPDILNMDGYKIEEYHSDTAQYEAEMAALQSENANLKAQLAAYDDMLENFLILIDQTTNGDVNGDGYTNAVDASVILGYYAYLSTGGTITLRNYMLEEGII